MLPAVLAPKQTPHRRPLPGWLQAGAVLILFLQNPAYVDETNRLSSVTYPSSTGLSTSYSYFGNTGDQHLETIQNFKSSGSTNVSKFDYTYNAVGTIATWTAKADAATSIVNTLSYPLPVGQK